MGSLVLAFSLDKQIEQAGAIAGLAAIIGLAVLSLLYFAQAREVKRLREWAGRAPERDAELQQRVAEDAARRATGIPAGAPPPAAARPATAAAVATAAAQSAASKPATAAGQAAPPKPATPVPAKPATPPGAPAPAGTPAPATPGAPAKPATPAPSAPTAKPATPAPAVPAAPAKPAPPAPGVPAPATAAAAGAPAARPRRTVTVGSTPSSATVPPRRDEPAERDQLFSARAVAATLIAAVLVIGLLFVTGIVGGGDDEKSPEKAAQTTPATDTGSAEVPAPAETPTAVLNGTAVTGLARQAADRLVARGYDVSKVTDAADQQQQVSHVGYADGFQAAAERVARIIGISASQVQLLDASTSAIAGEGVSVVVTMGLDKAQ